MAPREKPSKQDKNQQQNLTHTWHQARIEPEPHKSEVNALPSAFHLCWLIMTRQQENAIKHLFSKKSTILHHPFQGGARKDKTAKEQS